MLLNNASQIYVGDSPASAVYLGSTLIWSADDAFADTVGDFTKVFDEDFNTSASEGNFFDAYPEWDAYGLDGYMTNQSAPDGDHYGGDTNLSCHDGVLDLRLFVDGDGRCVGAAPFPSEPTGDYGQLYGRIVTKAKVDDPETGWKKAWLLWPNSEDWPGDGEVDFPEGSLTGQINAFMHRQDGVNGGDQDAYEDLGAFGTDWHTYVIEWAPGDLKFYLDGELVGHSTSRVPNTPMHYVMQTEINLDGPDPIPGETAHVLVDRVAVYEYTP